MSPELEQAVRERIELGYTKEQITAELLEVGYDIRTIETVIMAAMSSGLQQVHMVSSGTTALIGYVELISGVFALIRNEWKVFLGYFLCNIGFSGLIIFLPFLIPSPIPSSLVIFFSIVLAALAPLSFPILTFAFQRALLTKTESISYVSHVKWTLVNIIGIFWVSLAILLAVSTGLFLLIIPGIALSVYVMFAIHLRLTNQETGIKALVSSIELVYNRWWSVAGRLLFSSVVFGITVLPLVIAAFAILNSVGLVLTEEVIVFAIIQSLAFIPGLLSGQFLGLDALFILLIYGAVLFTAVLLVSFFVLCAMVLLFESLQKTANPLNYDIKEKLYFWIKIAVFAGIPITLLSNGFDFTLFM